MTEGERVTYRVGSDFGDERRTLLEEMIDDATVWHQRSVNLAPLAGRSAKLVFEASSERAARSRCGAREKKRRRAGDEVYEAVATVSARG